MDYPLFLSFGRIRVRSAWLLALAGIACGDPIELDTDGGESGNQPTESSAESTITTTGPVSVSAETGESGDPGGARQVDILFVVDNSGSMGEEQAQIAASVGTLIGALDAASPPVDYRIGVTTTDNGNPWCQGTGPEAGSLQATSCRSRPGDFITPADPSVDFLQLACHDHCTLEAIDLGGDTWLEWNNTTGSGNVAAGEVEDTLRCMLPQGISGCGFESPLENTWKALRRSATDADPDFGFVRPDSLVAVAVITDEVDCSYNNDWETIFLPDGERIFWSDPTAPAPSSAVCWNAGVQCEGSGVYDDCRAVNLDENGAQVDDTNADSDAVLRPLSRYTSFLAEFDAYMFALSGVGEDGLPVYADALSDPTYQSDFGIGPGCSGPGGEAVPPVRLREVVEQLSGPGNLHSICSGDYVEAMNAFANGILSRLP